MMMMKMKWVIVMINIWTFCSGASEFYSSTDHMTQLITLMEDLSQSLDIYLSAVEDQTNLLKRVRRTLMDMTEVSEDPERFISNPLTAYRLVRRFRDVGRAVNEVTKRNVSDDLEKLRFKVGLLPGDEDLNGIAMAVVRLQELYRLHPRDMMGSGNLQMLNPDEMFHIAEVAHKNGRFQCATVWAEETLQKLDEGIEAEVTKPEVLQLLSFKQVQDLPLHQGLIQQLLNHDDLNAVLQRVLSESLIPEFKDWDPLQQSLPPLHVHSWQSDYEALCRGDSVTPHRQRSLSCRYSTGGGNPRLMYAPVKEEEEWDEPLIIRFHDLLSLKETEVIKNLSRPKLDRAKVSDPLTGEKISTEVRVSKSAWLSDSESPVVARVNQRIADVTGLTMETAELLQVANYGIGGQYEPHYDSQDTQLVNDSALQTQGRRISTVLIYMSDVEVGGSTVFPNLGVALPPKRGSAVFWFNLFKNGENDPRTLHASCPVFIGNKWVSNKWIRSRGQEFRRRCSLSMSE